MKNIYAKTAICILAIALLTTIGAFARNFLASSDNSAPPPPPKVSVPTQPPVKAFGDGTGTFDATIEYPYDLRTARDMFLEIRVHPNALKFPKVSGHYVETTIRTWVVLDEVSVPTGLQTVDAYRDRPFEEIRLERERWNDSLDYTWSLVKLNRKLKVLNPLYLKDGRVKCSVLFQLGGAYHDLGTALLQDEYARISDVNWNWGSRNVKPY